MKTPKHIIRGRGAQSNPTNRFEKNTVEHFLEDLPTDEEREDLLYPHHKTVFKDVFPKTIFNKVTSPDLPFSYSANPYQGCEHGCVYCYARNTHEYWGYSAGKDFEQIILVKKSAPELVRQTLQKKNWKPELVTFSGNTDCYQPIERKLELTRNCLKVFAEFKHPVAVITKNAMVERDADILLELAKQNLTTVILSLNTLNDDVKGKLEPRTSSVRNVLRTIRSLTDAGIPVQVLAAPIIPSLNDNNIIDLVKAVADAGAININYEVVRLNGQIGAIFEDWAELQYPDRKNKIMHHIQDLHGGKVNDSRFGIRMKGEGLWADLIKQQFKVAKQKYLPNPKTVDFDFSLFNPKTDLQLNLF